MHPVGGGRHPVADIRVVPVYQLGQLVSVVVVVGTMQLGHVGHPAVRVTVGVTRHLEFGHGTVTVSVHSGTHKS